MNRRQFLITPIVLIPFTTVATEGALDALPDNEFIDLPGGRELFHEIVGKIRASGLEVDDFFPLGSPGVIFKAPGGGQAQVYRGGAAYTLGNIAFKEEHDVDVASWLNASANYRSIVADRAVEYVVNKSRSLEKTKVYMWPNSVSLEKDYDIQSHNHILVVSIIFGI